LWADRIVAVIPYSIFITGFNDAAERLDVKVVNAEYIEGMKPTNWVSKTRPKPHGTTHHQHLFEALKR
jgi:hypothetical protein